jgi:phage-related protein
MYDIIFYEDRNGYSDIKTWLRTLEKDSEKNKSSRMNRNKIYAYMDMLMEKGTRISENVTKHIEGDIWELRPLKNRIMYAYYKDNTFILLSHFEKKTQKTPVREIKKAQRYLKDYKERNE